MILLEKNKARGYTCHKASLFFLIQEAFCNSARGKTARKFRKLNPKLVINFKHQWRYKSDCCGNHLRLDITACKNVCVCVGSYSCYRAIMFFCIFDIELKLWLVQILTRKKRERLLARLPVIILRDWLNLQMTVALFFMDVNPWGYHTKLKEVIFAWYWKMDRFSSL